MKRGRWALWNRFDIRGRAGSDVEESTYLTRWRVVQTPLFGVYLHRFVRPDSTPTLHDHPWPFVSLVLRGGYIEAVIDQVPLVGLPSAKRRHIRWFNRKRIDQAHYVVSLDRNPTWTLVFVGRKVREWGYWETDPPGESPFHWRWTPWHQHRNHQPAEADR